VANATELLAMTPTTTHAPKAHFNLVANARFAPISRTSMTVIAAPAYIITTASVAP